MQKEDKQSLNTGDKEAEEWQLHRAKKRVQEQTEKEVESCA